MGSKCQVRGIIEKVRKPEKRWRKLVSKHCRDERRLDVVDERTKSEERVRRGRQDNELFEKYDTFQFVFPSWYRWTHIQPPLTVRESKRPRKVRVLANASSSDQLHMLSVFISQSPFHIFASSFSYGMIRTHRFKKLANPKNPISSTDLRSEPQARKKKKKKTGHCPKSKPATDPPTQIAQLSPSSSSDGFTILPKEFFLVDALDLAPRLLGKLIRRDDVVLRITEVLVARSFLYL